MFKDNLPHADLISLLDFASEATHIGFWVWFPPEDLTFWDAKLYEILGFDPSKDKATAENYFARIHPDDRELCQRISADFIESKGAGSAMDIRLQMPDGKIKYALVQGTAEHDEAGNITKVIGFMQDRTHEIESNQEQMRVERLESVNTLAQGVAHDFNNYLQMIQTSLTLINMQNQDEIKLDDLKAQLEIIERATMLSSALIAKMNDLAKGIEEGELESSHLRTCLTELDPLLRSMLGTGIQFDMTIDYDGYTNLSNLEMNQILVNLVKNSKEAIEGKGTISVKVFDSSVHGDDFICMQVIDDGSGIDKKEISKIFDPFFTTKRSINGQGLGLASVYNILRSKGGVIQVESELGASTTFSMYLRKSMATPVNTKPKEPKQPSKHKGNLRILHVEDNAELRKMFCTFLTLHGYQVTSAENGLDGLDKYQPDHFDLVISDVAMPQCDGPSMAQKIWEQSSEQKFIFLTGFHDDIAGQLPETHKNSSIHVKPVNMNALLTELLELSDSKQTQAA